MSMKLLRQHFRECISGLFYLHNVVKVVHLDIKPENILVDKDGVSKFADFGVSRFFDKKTEWLSSVSGTRTYHAPESFTQTRFRGRPLDIWALGVTFY